VGADLLGQSAFFDTPIAQHQQDLLFLGDADQSLAEGVALAEHEGVVVEEEHPGDVDSVAVAFELGRTISPST
jgi:hypothetical protein